MSVRVITKPEPFITTEEAKKHLNVDTATDNDYIDALVLAAVAWLDGPDGWLGRCLGEQTIEASASGFDCWPYGLPYPPIIEIVSVSYRDTADATQTLDPGSYRILPDGRLVEATGETWPSHVSAPDAVNVTYKAGYPVVEEKSTVPAPIRVAILMLVAQWYAIREPISIGESVSQLPFAVDALLQPFRNYQ